MSIKPVQLESLIALVREERGQISFEKLPIDPETFFTTLPVETLLRIGAPSTPLRVAIHQKDSRFVESSVYTVELNVEGRKGVILAVALEGAPPVLGSKFLEDLGLRFNRRSGELEPSSNPLLPRECEE